MKRGMEGGKWREMGEGGEREGYLALAVKGGGGRGRDVCMGKRGRGSLPQLWREG